MSNLTESTQASLCPRRGKSPFTWFKGVFGVLLNQQMLRSGTKVLPVHTQTSPVDPEDGCGYVESDFTVVSDLLDNPPPPSPLSTSLLPAKQALFFVRGNDISAQPCLKLSGNR